MTIKNNIIYNMFDDNGFHIQTKPGKYPDGTYSTNDNWVITNNTFGVSSTNREAILLYRTNTNFIIQNNIFYQTGQASPNNGRYMVSCYGGQNYSNIAVRNNLRDATTGVYNSYCTSGLLAGMTFTDNTQSDPLFTNAGIYDYSLQAASPAINAGIATNAPDLDYLGNRRDDGQPDIGAYEYTNNTTDTTPPAAPTNVSVQ